MAKYLLALDQGTTGSRCILFDRAGNIVSKAAREFRQIFPQDGWVEHDAREIWASQIGVAVEAMQRIGASAEDVFGIGITNQRETVVVWDKRTGEPICNAIVWQCRRTASDCDALKQLGYTDEIRARTGLLIDSYFSATKLKWILDNVSGARERANRGELLFGTVDSWLLYRLTGGKAHATDPSNASRTMLFNIHTLEWDSELLKLFDIPACMMPTVLPSSGIFGYTDPVLFGKSIPIAGIAGDQQAALFGQCCFDAGEAKNTYGTGGFLLMNTGDRAVASEKGLLTSIGWKLGDRTTYVLEGSVFVCGAVIQWLRDGLGLMKNAAESEEMAMQVPDTAGVYLVPAFVGLGAPYWDSYARGTLVGLTRATNRNHIVRAGLEAMAYQTADVLNLMYLEGRFPNRALRVDGGASANNFLLQFQADILGTDLVRPRCIETTALGAANLAGLAVGVYASLEEIRSVWNCDRSFSPTITDALRKEKLEGWHRAIGRSLEWIEPK